MAQQFFNKVFFNQIPMDPALKEVNAWYDKAVKACEMEDQKLRWVAIDGVLRDLQKAKTKFTDGIMWLPLSATGKNRSQVLGKLFTYLMLPAPLHGAKVEGMIYQMQQMRLICFELERYRRLNGGYPEKLDQLADKMDPSQLIDIFSGNHFTTNPKEPDTSYTVLELMGAMIMAKIVICV